MRHLAVYMMLVLGGNEKPTQADVEKAMASVGLEVDSDNLAKLMADLEGKELSELLEMKRWRRCLLMP